MNLSDIKINFLVEIEKIENSYLKVNLMERGFLKGKRIFKVHSFSINGPFIFQIDGTLYGLTKNESDLIKVKKPD